MLSAAVEGLLTLTARVRAPFATHQADVLERLVVGRPVEVRVLLISPSHALESGLEVLHAVARLITTRLLKKRRSEEAGSEE